MRANHNDQNAIDGNFAKAVIAKAVAGAAHFHRAGD